jgi:hypothetical protein
MSEAPQVTDQVWDELPEGMELITQGDDVVGIWLDPTVEVDLDEANRVLVKAGMPSLEPPD